MHEWHCDLLPYNLYKMQVMVFLEFYIFIIFICLILVGDRGFKRAEAFYICPGVPKF